MSKWICLWSGLVPAVIVGLALPAGGQVRSDAPDVSGQVRRSMRALRRANAAPPAEKSGGQTSSREIVDLARQVEAIQFVEKRKPIFASAGVLSPSQQQPAGTQPASQPSTQAAAIDRKTLQRLEKLSPEGIANPLALADSLFSSGYTRTAFVLYERALGLEQTEETKSWILFQMANCRAKSDPDAARKIYERLLSEYPDSPWSPVAGMQTRLIEWEKANNPRGLLAWAAKYTAGDNPGSSE